MQEYIQSIIDGIRQERQYQEDLEIYNKHLQDGFWIRYRFNSKAGRLEFWEEDAWGRHGRSWSVTRIPDTPDARINVSSFRHEISEDWYNIRNTWAKRREWTYAQVREFQRWLESTRWPDR
jgi:hypothetical protein